MYSYIGFIDGAAIQKDIKNKEVIAPGLLVGMVTTTLFYVIISIAAMVSTQDGNMFTLLNKMGLGGMLFFRIIIALTVFSLLNGFILISGPVLKSCFDGNVFFSKRYQNGQELSEKKAYLYMFVYNLIFLLVTVVLSLLLTLSPKESNAVNSDQYDYFYIINKLSDLISLYQFNIYTFVAIGILMNRQTKNIEVHKRKGAFTIGLIGTSLLSILMIFINLKLFVLDYIPGAGGAMTNGYQVNGSNITLMNALIATLSVVIVFVIITGLWHLNNINIKKYSIEHPEILIQEDKVKFSLDVLWKDTKLIFKKQRN